MLLAVAALTGAVPCAVPPATAASASPPITAEEAHTIAMEAYLFLYPLISMDLTRRQLTNMQAGESPIGGPPNTFINVREYPAADMRAVVRPNFDTLYSSAWLDLTAGPVVVSHADTRGRYFMLPMLDMYSDVFAVPGKRTSGTAAAAYAVVPSGWNGTLPDGIGRIDAPTPHVWVIGRTQTNGPADYDAVHEIQNGFNVTPLASWGKAAAPVVVKIDPTVDMKTPPKVQADTMPAEQYFAYGAALMGTNPPHDTDWSALRRFERIGLVPGQPFTLDSLAPEVRSAITSAPADALRLMAEKTPTLARIVNGWTMNTDSMGVYGNYYLKRAIVAQVGLGANQPEDAIYPMCVAGADGKPLTGDRDYVIHFTKDDLPPAHAFWSITMYDADGFQVANPINRFAIGDRDALKFNPDGSLDIYIRHTSPGPDRESNWLPSPASGVLGVTMRLYAPAPEALDGRWNPPPVRPAKEAAQ
jgi:hypothetical protein